MKAAIANLPESNLPSIPDLMVVFWSLINSVSHDYSYVYTHMYDTQPVEELSNNQKLWNLVVSNTVDADEDAYEIITYTVSFVKPFPVDKDYVKSSKDDRLPSNVTPFDNLPPCGFKYCRIMERLVTDEARDNVSNIKRGGSGNFPKFVESLTVGSTAIAFIRRKDGQVVATPHGFTRTVCKP